MSRRKQEAEDDVSDEEDSYWNRKKKKFKSISESDDSDDDDDDQDGADADDTSPKEVSKGKGKVAPKKGRVVSVDSDDDSVDSLLDVDDDDEKELGASNKKNGARTPGKKPVMELSSDDDEDDIDDLELNPNTHEYVKELQSRMTSFSERVNETIRLMDTQKRKSTQSNNVDDDDDDEEDILQRINAAGKVQTGDDVYNTYLKRTESAMGGQRGGGGSGETGLDDDAEGFSIKFVMTSDKKNSLDVKVGENSQFGPTFASLCEKIGKTRDEVKFILDGEQIDDTATPADVDIDEDGVIIEVRF